MTDQHDAPVTGLMASLCAGMFVFGIVMAILGAILPSLFATIAIDNCVPPEDALVDVGQREPVAAGSTVAAVVVAMSLVAETAACLAAKGGVPPTFVSPNVAGVGPDHMHRVYQAFTEFYFARSMKAETQRPPEEGR